MLVGLHSSPGPIAFYLPHLGYGGVERVVLNLAGGFVRSGYGVHLVVASAEGPMKREVPPGVELLDLGGKRVLASIPGLSRYLRRVRPRALFSAKTHANVVAITANRLAGTPALQIACEHSRHQLENPSSLRDRFALRLASRLYPRVDRIVAVAEEIAVACSRLAGVSSEDIAVIPNPVVDPDMASRMNEAANAPWLAEEDNTILSVGRLVPEKDFATLIEAFARVRSSARARLLILGEGRERDHLEELACRLGVADWVQLPGYVHNPLPIMRRADLFVMSSESEGFPVVLVEALFCGCPVVATRCSRAVEEVLQDGVLGDLVPIRDPAALAQSILRSLGRQPDRARLRRRAEDFSVEQVVQEYEALLEI